MNVVIAGGGTAGHVNPAIALARSMTGDDVVFIGTARGVESRIVPAAGFALETIDVRGFDRSRPYTLITAGGRAVRSLGAVRSVLRRTEASVLVGMGGYVSLPAAVAARSLSIPVVLHEQNVVLGLAHRAAKPLAARMAVSFEETLERSGPKGIYTGNPVLPEIVDLDIEAARSSGYRRFGLDPGRKTLLVFGGSLGARRLNEAAAGLSRAWGDRSDLQILHITGGEGAGEERSGEERSGGGALIYRTVAYVEAMGEAYAIADLALCRGGATTVAELTVLGVPSVIVPYPHHRDRQQERHGKILAAAGAAVLLADAETSTDSVAATTGPLLEDAGRLERMRHAAVGLGRPDAALALAEVVRGAAR